MKRLTLLITWFCLASPALAAAGGLTGRVLDTSGLPLPGVTVTVQGSGQDRPEVVTTDTDGTFKVDVPPGRYTVKLDLEGFQPQARAGLAVGVGGLALGDTVLALGAVSEQVTVTARADSALAPAEAGKPAVVDQTVIQQAILPNERYDDVLPLVPSVVRGPDGLISVAGARAPQGTLLVNGARETDPVTGEFAENLPLNAIDSVAVYPNAASAEFGGATSGVTTVQTQGGTDRYRVCVNSFTPRPRLAGGGVRGLDAWEPHTAFSGPIARGRLWFAQSFDYRYARVPYETLTGEQNSHLNSVLSWTQVDAAIRPGHQLTATLSFDPQTTRGAGITAFTTPSAEPDVRTGGWSAVLSDRVALDGVSTLEARVQVKHFDFQVTPISEARYVVSPQLVSGGYFNQQDRQAYRTEGAVVYSRTVDGRTGNHLVKAGATVGRVDFSGTNDSRQVDFRRSDGTLSQTVQFTGSPFLSALATEGAAFVEDDWAPASYLKLNGGLRYEQESIAGSGVLLPRLAVTFSPAGSRTTVSGTFGKFSDTLGIGAPAFSQMQDRLVTTYDPTGMVPLGSRLYVNTIGGPLRLPVALKWNVQVDRELGRGWTARIGYDERHGRDELVVDPQAVSDTAGLLLLSSTGASVGRSLELTIGQRHGPADSQVYFSYVRSSSRGDLNDLNVVDANFKLALVRPDAVGPLASDVPHRFLAWGVINLPARISFSPFFEVRNGFPYAVLNDNWNYVGAPNTRRLPPFASLDLVLSKRVTVLTLPIRIGVRVYNVTDRLNARDVQRDIALASFGTAYNGVGRQFRGIFEIDWGQRRK